MPRLSMRMSTLAPMIFVVASLILVGCGGGGGDKGINISSTVTNTSFQGFPSTQGGGLPPVIRDEVLEVTFAGPIDANIFGGFLTDVGQVVPTTFQGGRLVNGTTISVPYFAFTDQNAARQAFQVRDDSGAVVGLHPGVVGRHATKTNTIIFDPNVTAGISTLFGIPLSQGFASMNQYDVFVPANSGITIGGQMVPTFGSLPPITPPTFASSSNVSNLFVTGAGFLDRPAPALMQVTSANTELIGGVAGVDAIPYDDTIIVRFTESVDINTVDLQRNIIIRNLDLPNTQQPLGALVPVNFTIDSSLRELRFVPQPSFGSGPFSVLVQIVKFDTNDPIENAKNIKGLPSGATATQKPLAGNIGVISQTTFTTISQPGEPNPITIIENFDSTANRNGTFGAVYNPAEWFANGVSQLRGFMIDGEPLQTNLGTGPGARVQIAFQPPGTVNTGNPNCMTALCTYSSPFDDNQINNGINPNGGSRVQLIYLTKGGSELPNNAPHTIELVEWSPPNLTASGVTYNGYSMQIGHTGSSDGTGSNLSMLTTQFPNNFDFYNPQNEWINPLNHPASMSGLAAKASPILCFGPSPYTVTQLSGVFIPFPRLTIPFDVNDLNTGPNSNGMVVTPHVIIEHEVPAPHLTMNNMVNVAIGTNELTPTPFRRAYGKPGVDLAVAIDAVKYWTRFTLAKKNSSAQSTFYSVSNVTGTTYNYNSISVSPSFANRPAGTRIKFSLQSATSSSGTGMTTDSNLVANPYGPVYFDLNGNLNLSTLTTISGSNRRFFRYTAEFEANLLTNEVPFINSLIFGITF